MSSRKKSRRPSLKGSLNPSKRHRDRVNVELDNLAKLLPFPPEVISKLDKLSVLRLSASYLRTKSLFKGLKPTDAAEGSSTSSSDSMLDDVEKNGKLREMVLEALDGFLMVLTQEGELFYASETISDFLGVSQPSVIHQDFLRFVHADDHKVLLNNLKLVPSPPEQKICELRDDHEKAADDASCEGGDIDRERSFSCRFKCVLNTNAGFYKPFQCHGRLREMDQPNAEVPQLALFLMCSPVEITTSILEVRMKSMLFSTKNKLDLTFVDIDQKGKQIVGYTKKDITAQSSYCMMHYDDIPILKKMHEDLLATGKCEGTFRWLNKQLRWQWLTGSGQVILKNGQPDFVITTNKPLTDEEGEDEVRRRERDLGLVPTSPASMLTHLQISDTTHPSTSSFDQSPMEADTAQSLLTTDIGAPPACRPSVSSTSCASAGLSTDDLTWDFDADSLFEASGTSWVSAHASLADLDEIGKDDLVGELFHLDVQDIDFDQDPSGSEPPSNASSGSHCAVQDFPPTYTQPANHHVTSSQAPALPASKQRPTPVSSPTQQQFTPPSCALSPGHQRPANNPYSLNTNMAGRAATAPNPAYVSGPPPLTSGYHVNNVSSSRRSPLNQNGMPPLSQNGMPTLNQNGMPILTSTGYLNHGGMMENQNTMQPTSAPQPPSVQVPFVDDLVGHQTGLLRVQVGQPMKLNPVKMEPGRFNSSAGYYCNANGVEPRTMSDMSRMAGLSAQMNAAASNRYQNKYMNQGNLPAWAPAPPSPYSSGSSCSSFADPLNVQFSPTEVLVSPFASPRGDNDYGGNVHNNVPAAAVLSPAGQYYPPVSDKYRMVQRSRPRLPNSFAQQFVNIPEISPVGMVDDLVPGAHRVSPISAHNAGMANW